MFVALNFWKTYRTRYFKQLMASKISIGLPQNRKTRCEEWRTRNCKRMLRSSNGLTYKTLRTSESAWNKLKKCHVRAIPKILKTKRGEWLSLKHFSAKPKQTRPKNLIKTSIYINNFEFYKKLFPVCVIKTFSHFILLLLYKKHLTSVLKQHYCQCCVFV